MSADSYKKTDPSIQDRRGRPITPLKKIADDLVIRPAAPGDYAELLEMMRDFYASPAVAEEISEETMQRCIADCLADRQDVWALILETDEQTAGYAMCTRSYSTAFAGTCVWLEELYIKENFRGRGFGSTVLTYLEMQSRESDDVVRLRLEVEADNKGARAAYRKAGYAEVPYIQMSREL
ncbi:MAG: GNAT family N-acetyltransferase [Actinomycetaceae bacterium]|nr:GNAT family N-acetyltransferase [Actinomycetaceae bacterium]